MHKLYHIIGVPLERNFRFILRSNMICNNPVMHKDAQIAFNIWGPDIMYLKEASTQRNPKKPRENYAPEEKVKQLKKKNKRKREGPF